MLSTPPNSVNSIVRHMCRFVRHLHGKRSKTGDAQPVSRKQSAQQRGSRKGASDRDPVSFGGVSERDPTSLGAVTRHSGHSNGVRGPFDIDAFDER